jgi:hypothetical protein
MSTVVTRWLPILCYVVASQMACLMKQHRQSEYCKDHATEMFDFLQRERIFG